MSKNGWTRQPDSWKSGSTRRWRAVRAEHLAENPYCVGPIDPTNDEALGTCGEQATIVDHIDGTDYATQRYDRSKLRSLCSTHHDIRTGHQGQAALQARRAVSDQKDVPHSRDWWGTAPVLRS